MKTSKQFIWQGIYTRHPKFVTMSQNLVGWKENGKPKLMSKVKTHD